MFGICNLAIAPLRSEADDRSEMVSQLLFGETFEVVARQNQWLQVRTTFDGYLGWMDSKQQIEISGAAYEMLQAAPEVLNGDLIEYVHDSRGELLPIPLGASLKFLDVPEVNTKQYAFEGLRVHWQPDQNNVIRTAFLYLNTPYLWGGRTPFGIDCSGLTQMVYKLCGFSLPRDASQQALQGEPLSFIEESQPGDLAFFDNEEGAIIHVGLIMDDNYILHASGKVRVDRLDHLGIYNAETNRHTHKLRVIKTYF